MRKRIRRLIRNFGIDIVRYRKEPIIPSDLGLDNIEIIKAVRPYTMTSPERVAALTEAVKYIGAADIPGAIVECGVWAGGSMMAVAYQLLKLAVNDRQLYLFDTFEGMVRPTDQDVSFSGEPAITRFDRDKRTDDSSFWCYASIEDVRRNLYSTGYDAGRIKFIKGKVEDTVPSCAPERIALLRLDTDLYESTKHEMNYLYPRLSTGGVLIIDDYGHWKGSRKAVDEYFEENKIRILLNRIDYTGRIAVKP